ncbi:hypothetical protein NEOC65_000379 [Neochlamydia sp. AcF65]|nr:hypothetical protein [Neochlamydia sp. AcF65]MBS4171054.1 hypothetical protein [Neochlamydia sp. AcF95]
MASEQGLHTFAKLSPLFSTFKILILLNQLQLFKEKQE